MKGRAALLVAMLMAAPSLAAEAPRQERDAPPVSEVAARGIHDFAACVVSASALAPRQVLAMDYRTADYRQALNRLGRGFGRCTPGNNIRSSGVLFAGGLAEALLAPTGGRAPGWWVTGVTRGPAIVARSDSEVMALCTVREAPRDVAALLGTDPMSAEEAVVFTTLQPVLVKCLRSGQTARLNRPGLRAVLALAAYRLVQNDASAGTAARGI